MLKGKRYFWRVQVRNIDGSYGPLSDIWNFSTYIPVPSAPQLANATPYPNLPDYIILKWKKVTYADQYSVELSMMQTFSDIYKNASTSDTTININGISEGQKYYWRVQANNVEGTSPWSNTSNFTTIIAPTDLVLQRSGSNEITLTWINNSKVEDGYIIERKQSPQTSFTVLDTIKGSGTEFKDKTVESGQTYTYRVQAYKDSAVSDYSNEASLTLTGIKKEEEVPTEYSIDQNYPNPFNPSTKIKFALPKTAQTNIIIYDLLGRKIRTLLNNELEAGYYEISFDANNLPGGIYFYRIQSGDFIQTKKMILMK